MHKKEAYRLTWDEFDEAWSPRFAGDQIVRRTGKLAGFGPPQNQTSAVAAQVVMRAEIQGQTLVRQLLSCELLRQRITPLPAKLSGFFSSAKANLRNAP